MYSSGDDDPYDLYRVDPESKALTLDVSKMMTDSKSTPLISTPKGSIKQKPNLVRPNTDTPWHEDDIDEMMDDMKVQLDSLCHTQTSSSPVIPIAADENKQVDVHLASMQRVERGEEAAVDAGDEQYGEIRVMNEEQTNATKRERRRSSACSVYRQKSREKWDEEEISSTFDDMSKELKHLYTNSGCSLHALTMDTATIDRQESQESER